MKKLATQNKYTWAIVGLIILAGAIILASWLPGLFQTGTVADSQEIIQAITTEFPDTDIESDIANPTTVVFVHNGDSEQCKRAMDFTSNAVDQYSDFNMVVYQVLQDETGDYLSRSEEFDADSCWLDTNLTQGWAVFPTLFVGNQVFVGYGPRTRNAITDELASLGFVPNDQ